MSRSSFLGPSLIWVVLAAVMPSAAAQKPTSKGQAPAGAEKIVLGINGDWWDSSGNRLLFASLLNGTCVFARWGSLQIVDTGSGALQVFDHETMTAQCPPGCKRDNRVPENLRCAATTTQAAGSAVQASAAGNLSLQRVFDFLRKNPQMYVSAAARGVEEMPQEAVLPIMGSEVNLAAALESVATGTYAVALESVSGTGTTGVTGKVSWAPGSPAKLSAPKIRPGLYRLSITVEGGESEASEAWVLLSATHQFETDAKEFHQAAEVAMSWGEKVDESGKRSWLRACLQSLAAGQSE